MQALLILARGGIDIERRQGAPVFFCGCRLGVIEATREASAAATSAIATVSSTEAASHGPRRPAGGPVHAYDAAVKGVAVELGESGVCIFFLILFLLYRAAMLCGSPGLDEAAADADAIAIAFIATVLLACVLDFIVSKEQEVRMGDTACIMVGMMEANYMETWRRGSRGMSEADQVGWRKNGGAAEGEEELLAMAGEGRRRSCSTV